MKHIPEDSASYYHFAPLAVVNGVLEIGITDPENIEARDALQFIATKLGMPFKIFLISQDDFALILESYHGLTGEVTKALSELEVDIGDVDKESLIKESVEKTKAGEIVVSKNCETNIPGLFAAGDVTDIPFKQIIIAAGQGTCALLQAVNYLNRLKQ